MIIRKHTLASVIPIIVLLISACEKRECNQFIDTDAGIGFYTVTEDEEFDSSLTNFTVFGKGAEDSLLYDAVANASAIRVPLDPNKDSSSLIFQTDTLSDTIHIHYSRELNLISQECGFITDYHVRKVNASHNHFDSVVVTNNIITDNDNEEHFKIYLSPPDTIGN